MKKQFNPLLGGLALSASVLALSAVWVSEASAGIAATRHNLGSTNTSFNRFQSTVAGALNNEICVFCHTPHGGDTNAAVPLWNKALPTGTYQTYSSGSLQAARATDGIASTPQIGSVSIACLSCHDGTQAMNNFINAPGSGGFTATGSIMPGTWSSGNLTPVNANGTMGTGVANLTADLRNDHPIGIAYCGGSPSTGAGPRGVTGQEFATCPDTDFNGNTTLNNQGSLQVVIAGQGANSVWYIEKNGSAGRQKTDLPLYTRNFGGTTGPSVECGTCHDPHTDSQTMFLRVNNTGSAVCVSCHVK